MRLLSILCLIFLATLTSAAQTNTGNLINETGSTIVGADNSGSGSGEVQLQTKGLTGFRLLNNGNAVVHKNLGINTPNPLVPLHFTVKYPADTTASESMIMFETPTGTDPAGVVHTPFEIYQRSTVFGNDRTDSVGIGFSGVGGSQGMGNFGFLFEDAYGFPSQAELHLIYTPLDGSGQHRPWTWTIDRQTGDAVVVTSGVSHFYGAGWLQQGGAEFHIQPTSIGAVASLFGHRGDVSFETAANQGAGAFQIRMAALPQDAAKTAISFGGLVNLSIMGGGAVNVTNADGSQGAINAVYKSGGTAGVTVSGSSCTVTAIRGGIITGATCLP